MLCKQAARLQTYNLSSIRFIFALLTAFLTKNDAYDLKQFFHCNPERWWVSISHTPPPSDTDGIITTVSEASGEQTPRRRRQQQQDHHTSEAAAI